MRKKSNLLIINDSVQMEALYNVLTRNNGYFERKVRRWFSKNFNTPIQETYTMPWPDILLHYYESNLENLSYNDVIGLAETEYLPKIADKLKKQEEKREKDFMDKLLSEQARQTAHIKSDEEQKADEGNDEGNEKAFVMDPSEVPDYLLVDAEEENMTEINFKEEDFKEDIED